MVETLSKLENLKVGKGMTRSDHRLPHVNKRECIIYKCQKVDDKNKSTVKMDTGIHITRRVKNNKQKK